jgi:hypothetical protein
LREIKRLDFLTNQELDSSIYKIKKGGFVFFTKNIKLFSFELFVFFLHIKCTLDIIFKTPSHKRLRLCGFVLGLWVLSFFGWRLGRDMRSSYFWFRYVDDIIDGDLEYAGSLENFRKAKKQILQSLEDIDLVINLNLQKIDFLIIHVYNSGLSSGYDYQPLMLRLFNALEYDMIRIKQKKIYSKSSEIKEYFDNLDIPSVAMTLNLINEKSITLKDLEPLIDATRTRYNVRDFVQDLQAGIVNIPLEEIKQYGINIETCQNISSLEEMIKHVPFRMWFTDQVGYMEKKLARGKKIVKEQPLRFRTWLALTLCFIRPCNINLKKWKILII